MVWLLDKMKDKMSGGSRVVASEQRAYGHAASHPLALVEKDSAPVFTHSVKIMMLSMKTPV
jgi:hypothetical protein